MNLKFLPFVVGMALVSTSVNAETLEELNVEGPVVLDSTLRVKGDATYEGLLNAGETKLGCLNVRNPYVVVNKGGGEKKSI